MTAGHREWPDYLDHLDVAKLEVDLDTCTATRTDYIAFVLEWNDHYDGKSDAHVAE
jgi:hypothetical protein